ncbi:SH3 domain-containing protein [Devosia sp. A449]
MLASAGAAFAAPATSTANVNVRSGPGTSYGVVDVLRRGDRVEVTGCRGGWCYIEKRGPDGWVSANYLNSRRGNGGGYNVSPGFSFEFNFGTAPTPQRPRPPRPDNGGWHGGGWNGGHGDWGGDRDRDRDDGPRRPRYWN